MSSFAAGLLRGVVATFSGLLVAGGTLTLAADRAGPGTPTLVAVSPSPGTLVVPQVTGQAYVFAKGILQDGGFAWRVTGPVQGFAADTVVEQRPVAGTVVVDTGAPTVTLVLERNRTYGEQGLPQNAAPYAGTALRLAVGVAQPRGALAPLSVPSRLATALAGRVTAKKAAGTTRVHARPKRSR